MLMLSECILIEMAKPLGNEYSIRKWEPKIIYTCESLVRGFPVRLLVVLYFISLASSWCVWVVGWLTYQRGRNSILIKNLETILSEE